MSDEISNKTEPTDSQEEFKDLPLGELREQDATAVKGGAEPVDKAAKKGGTK